VRNVLVVVSRWFGGVFLHNDRFKHINNASRMILVNHGYIKKVRKGAVDQDSNQTSAFEEA
jgi:hypothetical protein